jgi:OmpA family
MKASTFIPIRLFLLCGLLGGLATPQATQRLDSLIALWGDSEVHLELEGHTDSINPPSVNLKLSEDRIAAVNHYLMQHSKARLSTKVNAQGENDPRDNNGSEQGKAHNRRVEIKYVLLKDGNFTFSGQRGSTMSLPTSAITECSVCNTDFSMDYFGTDASIAAAGIGMQTVDGGSLTTAGMVRPKMGCGSKPKKHTCDSIRACFSFPIQTTDTAYSAWVSNADGLWEPFPVYSRKGNTIEFCIDNYCWCRYPNCDKRGNLPPLHRRCVVKDASGLRILRSNITLLEKPKPRQFQLGQGYRHDTLIRANYKSVAADANGQLWICSSIVGILADGDSVRRRDTMFNSKVAFLSDYRPIAFSDTLQRIKVKRKLNVTAVGYYVKEADTTFAFTQVDQRTFEAPKLNYQHMLVFKKGTGKGKGIQKDPNRIRTKYKARRQRFVSKVKKL